MLIHVAETNIFIKDEGTGSPILFLHGNPDTSDIWDAVISRVRHPAYAGGLPALVAGGLALNSLISIIPVIVIVLPIMIYRTMLEDKMLRDELAGYADYAAKVRYRLIPGGW